MCYVRAYLRASTDDQDANRARDQLKAFASERKLEIVSWYVENESGTKLARPELFKLLADAHEGDILLVEQVDRLSRLTDADWQKLKAELAARKVRVVALDLPTSWMMAAKAGDEFTNRLFESINGMLLDMLAAVARKDYDDRRRRQAQGQTKAKAEGRYKGRSENTERNASGGGIALPTALPLPRPMAASRDRRPPRRRPGTGPDPRWELPAKAGLFRFWIPLSLKRDPHFRGC